MNVKAKRIAIILFAVVFFAGGAGVSSAAFEYNLLESIPGFYSEGEVMTDFPALVLAIYKFGIWTVGIAGLFMLVIGGVMYTGSAGNTSVAGSAKNIIRDSLVGIVAAMGAYLFLYVINPDLTRIRIDFMDPAPLEDEAYEVSGAMSGDLVQVNNCLVDVSFATALDKIKRDANYSKIMKPVVVSGLRTEKKQIALIKENCGDYPSSGPCSPPTCLLRNGTSSCPHTTGYAADIWAFTPDGKSQAISQKQCMQDLPACRANKYQAALIQAMRNEGFCVLDSEPWHFERRPGMSPNCN